MTWKTLSPSNSTTHFLGHCGDFLFSFLYECLLSVLLDIHVPPHNIEITLLIDDVCFGKQCDVQDGPEKENLDSKPFQSGHDFSNFFCPQTRNMWWVSPCCAAISSLHLQHSNCKEVRGTNESSHWMELKTRTWLAWAPEIHTGRESSLAEVLWGHLLSKTAVPGGAGQHQS